MSIFSKVVKPSVSFSNFPLNETNLLTCNFGQLIPCYLREVVPNDRFRINGMSDIKFAPMIAPMMHNVHVSFHFFFVPNRIVYKDWETFITGSRDGRVLDEAEVPDAPYMYWDNVVPDGKDNGTLLDYLGMPPHVQAADDPVKISSIPLLDYIHVWYQFYRDENLEIDGPVSPSSQYTGKIDYWQIFDSLKNNAFFNQDYDFADMAASGFFNGMPKYRAFKKDYFTAALPSPQKGAPVTIGLVGNAPIKVDSLGAQIYNTDESLYGSLNGPLQDTANHFLYFVGSVGQSDGPIEVGDAQQPLGLTALSFDEVKGLYAGLQSASAITINQLREAIAMQEILESINRTGSRYNEFLLGTFGTTPVDYRLQRPEFLGGWTQSVNVQTVLQTNGYGGDGDFNMTGYAAGRAFSAGSDHVLTHTFQEHGFIIGIMSVMPEAGYFQGLQKHWSRFHRYDYYMPQTANLGEQAITQGELYFTGDESKDNTIFGYIPRWAEYKTSWNSIHGDFRGSLDFYHMYRKFNSAPTLSPEFISTASVQPRPFAVWEDQQGTNLIWAELYFNVMASRPMPYHATPKLSSLC